MYSIKKSQKKAFLLLIQKPYNKKLTYIIQQDKTLYQANNQMIAKLIYVDDPNALESIRQTLKTRSQFVQNPYFDTYFDKITQLKNTKEPVFAIGIDSKQSNHIKIIYSLHTEYKLTRQLCKCVHIQELYTFPDVTNNQIEEFHRDLIPQLDCYKIVAINIAENFLLKPNQKFMSIESKAML